MLVRDAQDEVREVFLGGFPGQLVSGLVWLAAAMAASAGARTAAVLILIVGGTFIFPLTLLTLKLMGRRATLSRENPLGAMATQVAFTIPLSYPLIWMACVHHPTWFFPALMVVVGAHYLPFLFLYGMPHFAAAAVVIVVEAFLIATRRGDDFAIGGWVMGGTLLGLAIVGLVVARAQRQRPVAAPTGPRVKDPRG